MENIRLIWTGEWPLWQIFALTLILILLVGWIYRAEVLKGTAGPLRWILPTLRCLAMFTIVLTLAGPVLRMQKEEGNRGKITVFLDSSESMTLKDKTFSAARKILLAKEHGFLPENSGLIDFGLYDASCDLKNLASLLRENETDSPSAETLAEIRSLANAIIKNLNEANSTVKQKFKPNSLLEEIWHNSEGSNWGDFVNEENFSKKNPTLFSYLEKAETKRNVGDNYLRRIRAFLSPPMDGDYVFWLHSDDSSVLRIAKPGTEQFRKVVEVKSFTSPSWNESKKSEKLNLQKGMVYPIEVIHKEGTGEDFCAFGWTLPSGIDEKPIPKKRFSAPMSSTEDLASLNLPEQIREKFSEIIKPSTKNQKIDFDAMAIEALEVSYLLEETFNDYAEHLLNQNIIPINKAISSLQEFTRADRAIRLLNHPKNGFLEEFKETHLMEIRNLSENSTEVIWDNFSEIDLLDLKLEAASSSTDLSTGILSTLKVEGEDEKVSSATRGAAVLISDGGHNREGSPLETAKLLSARSLPIYAVGLGSDEAPPDFALLRASVPDSVYQEDRIRGVLATKDNLLPGTPYTVIIKDSTGEQVWKKSLVGLQSGMGQLSFDFSAKKIVDRMISGLSELEREAMRTVALSFEVFIEPVDGEAELENNRLSFSIDASRRKNRLLILDSRPRWETRYLNNLFERDDRWEVSCVWGKPVSSGQKLPRGEELGEFPEIKQELLKFDLIIFGEIAPEEFSSEEQRWIVEFVSQRAGGILFIDGPRQKLRTFEGTEKHPVFSLLPVAWTKEGPLRLSPKSFHRPEASNRLQALTLDPIEERNEEVWKHLPLPAWTSPVETIPGTESFLEVVIDGNAENQTTSVRVPVLAGKTVGAGRSFYLGFDESWRWRYEVADLYHQRFWNQILGIIMESPFAMNQAQISMDLGGSIHDLGKTIPIRVRLRDSEGKAPEPPYPEVDALIWKDEEVVATIPLNGKKSTNGLFTGEVFGLEASSYALSVRAPKIIDQMEFAEQKLPFEVKSGPNQERNFLTCDENLLSEMAEISGGRFYREENFHELKEALRSISSGRTIITEIILWQSFGWLGFVVSLLALEMFLRKRAGML